MLIVKFNCLDIAIIMMAMTEDGIIHQGGGLREAITHPPGGETDPGDLLLLIREE